MTKYNVPKGVSDLIKPSGHNYSKFFRYSCETKNKLEPCISIEGNPEDIPSQILNYRQQLIRNVQEIIAVEFTVDRMIIGGSLTPYTGNAISMLHSIYGVPYIEGASIKGAIRNSILQESEKEEEWVKYAFGVSSDSDEDTYGKGNLIFFDSFPKAKFTLVKDIQAPHYSEYYKEENQKFTDEEGPNIFGFYVVENTTFVILIGVLGQTIEVKETIKSHVITALSEYGIGGKKAVGYGLAKQVKEFAEVQKIIEERANELEQQRIARMTPIERLNDILDHLANTKQDIEKSKNEIYQSVIELVEQDPQLAKRLLKYWELYDTGKPSKKQQLKIEKLKSYVKEH